MVHSVLTCHPQRSRGTLRVALAPPSVEWTLLSAASEAPGHAVSIRRQNTLPDTNRPHPTRRSRASPRSAHKGRTPPRLSPRHPTIRVISCPREGHDFTRARTHPASVIPSEVEGPCVLAKRGASSFFAHFAKKGGRQHCRKARFLWEGHDFSRAIKTRNRFRHRQPARPDKKQIARSPLFQSLRRPVNHLPRDGIILNLDVAAGNAAPLPFSLLRRHPYRSRHLDQSVQFFRHASLAETTCYSQV
jgi:hypothetical protein